MKRLPVLATAIVGLAVAIMIALGIWQLRRASEKRVLIALYAENLRKPEVALPPTLGANDPLLFRRTRGLCLEAVQWTTISGRDANGRSGWRHIASCRTGAEGPGFLADLGVSNDFNATSKWRGGDVAGVLGPEPVGNSLAGRLLKGVPVSRALIVATAAAPGLVATARPDPSEVANNHLSYAVQWFIFAGVASLIYALALRRRRTKEKLNA